MSRRWNLHNWKSWRESDLFTWYHCHSLARFALSRKAAVENSPAFQRRVFCAYERIPQGRLKFISTNTVRRIQRGIFSTTPETPPETSSSGDAPPVH